MFAALPNLNDLYIRCKSLDGYPYSYPPIYWFPDTITKCNGSETVFELPDLERFDGSYNSIPSNVKTFKVWSFPKLIYSRTVLGGYAEWVEEILCPSVEELGGYAGGGGLRNYTSLRKIVLGPIKTLGDGTAQSFTESPNLIHLEICGNGGYLINSFSFAGWNPIMALRTDTTSEDYVDLREDTSFANNFMQFFSNFRKYLILRLVNRPSSTALTLTLSGGVYQVVYGLDSSYNTDPASTAQTITLSDLGITSDDLTELEVSSGIMTSTIYATWLDTYRNAINWNIAHA